MQFRPLFSDKRNLIITALALLFMGVVACAEPPAVTPVDLPPSIVELSPNTPAPQPPPDATKPIPILSKSYRWFGIKNYTGPVTWEIEGDKATAWIKELDKPRSVIGVVSGDAEPTEAEIPVGAVCVYGKAKGTIKLVALGIVNGKPKKFPTVTIAVDGDVPVPPVPPDPDPKPPGPTPAPLPGDGLQVLIVYDGDPNTLPPAQQAIIFGQDVRTYLDSHCAKLPSGAPARRMYPKKTDVSQGEEVWKTGMKLADGQKLPFVVISNPQKGGGFKGDLPATADEFMKLVKKYGGD